MSTGLPLVFLIAADAMMQDCAILEVSARNTAKLSALAAVASISGAVFARRRPQRPTRALLFAMCTPPPSNAERRSWRAYRPWVVFAASAALPVSALFVEVLYLMGGLIQGQIEDRSQLLVMAGTLATLGTISASVVATCVTFLYPFEKGTHALNGIVSYPCIPGFNLF